jgi:hypothetical protein
MSSLCWGDKAGPMLYFTAQRFLIEANTILKLDGAARLFTKSHDWSFEIFELLQLLSHFFRALASKDRVGTFEST